jgi:hypothetical protein
MPWPTHPSWCDTWFDDFDVRVRQVKSSSVGLCFHFVFSGAVVVLVAVALACCLALAAASHHRPSVRESVNQSACLRSSWLVQQLLRS